MTFPARLLLFLLIMLPQTSVAEQQISISTPPDSLQQWYKPVNKRQVWLHTMFKLARSMQAIEDYAEKQDFERLEKWINRFGDSYRSLPVKVPEWSDEIELQRLEQLEAAYENKDVTAIKTALNKLKVSCRSCHNENKAVSVISMRSPTYDKVKVNDSLSNQSVDYANAMKALRTEVNRIKIAVDDQRWTSAQTAARRLDHLLQDQQQTCDHCHQDTYPKQRILGPPTTQSLQNLDSALNNKDRKAVGKMLGQIGVIVCARCHAVHRTLADIRKELQ
jgi:hypothetical protein